MVIAIILLITYLFSIIVAGHGAVPMGLILVLPLIVGRFDSWGMLVILSGWIGIVGLISATLLFRSNHMKQLTYQFSSSIILYLLWLGFAVMGNDESGSLFRFC